MIADIGGTALASIASEEDVFSMFRSKGGTKITFGENL